MNAWIIAHAHACERAVKRLISHPIGTLLSVFVIAIAITLPLGLYTVFTNVTAAASRVNTDPNVNVYLVLGATEANARDVEQRLRAGPNVRSVRFISRDAALAEMKRIASFAELLTNLETNPLPHAFSIQPKSSEPEALAEMRREISVMPKVEHVVMDFEWAQKLKRFASFAERLMMLLGLILALAVVFVTGNTIRLQILTQKDEIEVSQLIGATRRFIRRPFLYFGALQGLFAGLVAVAVVMGFIVWAGTEVHALTASYGSEFALQSPTLEQATGVVLMSAAMGWLGSFLSVWLYLRRTRR
ncbi:MAG: ABC transporter permease [Betaproteobacteria bacterium]|nr:ABC transporter permease [Betaproteobacteria bacterium]